MVARGEMQRLGQVWPLLMAKEQQLETDCNDVSGRLHDKGLEIRSLKVESKSQTASANNVAAEGHKGLREAQEEARSAEDRSRGVLYRLRAEVRVNQESRISYETERAVVDSLKSEILGLELRSRDRLNDEKRKALVARGLEGSGARS